MLLTKFQRYFFLGCWWLKPSVNWLNKVIFSKFNLFVVPLREIKGACGSAQPHI
ncbi:hypothetical protein HanIR_Chr03g0130061 [Helianthus annuus]|nr:hypothetical protein HanIR_Chr03g0130061 [Helianthus annuus]